MKTLYPLSAARCCSRSPGRSAARLELVSSSALPPLSDVVVSWIDLLKTGELVGNAGASLYRAGAGLAAGDRDRRRARHRHGVVEADQRAARPDRRDFLSAAEIGADPGHGDLARLRRRLENPADLPRLHDAGHDRRLQRRARRASRRWSGRRAAWAPTGCACCGTWCCRARCRNCSTASAPRWRCRSSCWCRPS